MLAVMGPALQIAEYAVVVRTAQVAAPWLLPLFGPAYAQLGILFTVLLCMQWINGTGRPAIRFLSATWPSGRIRCALCLSGGICMTISLLATRQHAAYAAAVAMLAGALLITGQAIFAALRRSHTTEVTDNPAPI